MPNAVPEADERREVKPDELNGILARHRKWTSSPEYVEWLAAGTDEQRAGLEHGRADLRGANLQNADLRKADLRSADLREADLRNAELSERFGGRGDPRLESACQLADARLKGAKLGGAILRGVDLKDADLEEATLEGADLCYADLRGATLKRVNFTGAVLINVQGLPGARLRDVDFTGARGITGTSFARADLTGAKLPIGAEGFPSLGAVDRISSSAQTAFLSMLLACAYSWLAISATSDGALFTNSTASPLPIIQTPIPIARFYLAVPLILLASFAWLHLYLQDMWSALAQLPAMFPDGKALDERASPWLLTGLVRAHFELLAKDRPPLSRLKVGISVLLAWWLVPLTLALFWLRYLPRHDIRGTVLHAVLLVVAVVAAIRFQHLAKLTLRGERRPPILWPRKRWRRLRSARVRLWGQRAKGVADRGWKLTTVGAVLLLATTFVSLGAINAPMADLQDADLQGAHLERALLKGANLLHANLRGAHLDGADLSEALNVTQSQIDQACGVAVILPPGLVPPKPCP